MPLNLPPAMQLNLPLNMGPLTLPLTNRNLALGAAAATTLTVTLGLALRSSSKTRRTKKPFIASPLKALPEDTSELPYPPDILPGGRDVNTPYGHIRVFEWGPEDGAKVLLLHGISTPCISLAGLASELVHQGYRVMLFDFFGRGYSDAPADVKYDARLYTTQILLVLASSSLAWTGDDAFNLIGYSLGGGVAVSFARYFPRMVRSLNLVASGGLIRREHVSFHSRVLYSTGLFPEWVLERLVRRRLAPREADGEEEMAVERKGDSDATGGESFDQAVLKVGKKKVKVSDVLGWQLREHKGYIKAFMSSIRYAPIYEQREDWEELGKLLAERREEGGEALPGLKGGRVQFVLGKNDPVIVKEELLHDAEAFLGEDGVDAMWLDCGHEIAMTKGVGVAKMAIGFWEGDW
ncbi:hypothetical protein OQA88_6640 [Cercophora sp. LCS_1]